MKLPALAILMLCSAIASAQDKSGYVQYNKLIDLKGTDYVIATVVNYGKLMAENAWHLLFINAATGGTRRAGFPDGALVGKVEQVYLEPLKINKVLVSARAVNLNGDKTIDYNDPQQIFILSLDGAEKTQVTDDRFFVQEWAVNSHSGAVVITGHYDTNSNGKYDKRDKNDILIYDLKTMRIISK